MTPAMDPSLQGLDACGGCAGHRTETPAAIDNRPGLPAIAYRTGTWQSFFQSMLAGLSGAELPALGRLTTRDSDDFSIALLDAWAMVADVLTFYQERIANESYVRTAIERGSILELARAIGYELRPGVAASVNLAFSLEDAKGAPPEVTIPAGTRVQSIPGPGEVPQVYETSEAIVARAEWNALVPRKTRSTVIAAERKHLYFEGIATNLRQGDAILIVGDERKGNKASERWDFRRLTEVELDRARNRTRVTWIEGLGSTRWKDVAPASSGVTVFALRQRAALFGAAAPEFRAMPGDLQASYLGLKGKEQLPAKVPAEWPEFDLAKEGALLDTVHLDARYPQIVEKSWVVLSIPSYDELYSVEAVEEDSCSNFTLTARTTRLTLRGENLREKFNTARRSTTVFGQSEPLVVADEPIDDDLLPGAPSVLLDRAILAPEQGRRMIVTGLDENGKAVIEEVVLGACTLVGGLSALRLAGEVGLVHRYQRSSVAILANVAPATHGETAAVEVLGTGDASAENQRFVLRQSPVTHVAAKAASGAVSTLEVRVGDLRWEEVPSLYARRPNERIYIARTGDDGVTTIQFGNGRSGARLPAGQENVVARYRKGIGVEGRVKAEQLSLLMTRPLGVRGVRNPLASAGAQERQSLSDARRNAPLSVLTLGRIVSLQDFEDFARGFSGIGKALASWVWNGDARQVFLTVAAADGAEVKEDDALLSNLRGAIALAADPGVRVSVALYRPMTFQIQADLRIDKDRLSADVLKAVESALRARFSFEARSFGEAVSKSEIVAAIQGVAGVIMVDLNGFRRLDDQVFTGHPGYLPCEAPLAGAGLSSTQPAELLTLDPGLLALQVIA